MRHAIAVLGAVAMALTSSMAFAWGEPGHMLVGAIAQRYLEQTNPAVARQVVDLLGTMDLAQATTWADCARDVHKTAAGTFVYELSDKTPDVCQSNALKQDIAAMQAYAGRNWDQCVYTPTEGCHGAFHFADVAYQHGEYRNTWVGTGPHDIVGIIGQAYAMLKTGSSTGPANFASRREALLILAHLVGDLHQPLHVGAVYLDAHGQITDPDAAGLARDYCEGTTRVPCTIGGNAITIGAKQNFHGTWDTIDKTLSLAKNPGLVKAALRVAQTPGAPEGWASIWASESVAEARRVAFRGLTYRFVGTDTKPAWTARAADERAYASARAAEQRQQITRAGARLAQILIAALSR